MQDSVLNVFVEREQVGVTFSGPGPDDRGTGSAKDSHPLNRQKERGDAYFSQSFPQLFVCRCIYLRDEAQ